MMGFHLLRLLRLHGGRECAGLSTNNTYRQCSLTQTDKEEHSRNFPRGSAGSKSNCSMVRRSRVLFLLWTTDSVRPREEVIIRYESSRTSSVSMTKDERRRENCGRGKETEKGAETEREEGAGAKGKCEKGRTEKLSRRPVVVFYFVFPEFAP